MKHANFKIKLLNYIPSNQWITYDLLYECIENRCDINIDSEIMEKICYELIQENFIEESKVESISYDETGISTYTIYKKLKNINQ